jgi:glycosyltransferase involved in cell wall biosynthesis
MDWYPNQDAVRYFAAEIFPHIRRRFPKAIFRIAGRASSTKFARAFAQMQNVEFTGEVADMRSEVARATVCVVPLRIGSGTRMKILEAAAMGKAIVSTSLGAEGLDLEDGREILVRDDPHSFANAVNELLTDPNRRMDLGQAARRRVDERYSLRCLTHQLREVVSQFGQPQMSVVA